MARLALAFLLPALALSYRFYNGPVAADDKLGATTAGVLSVEGRQPISPPRPRTGGSSSIVDGNGNPNQGFGDMLLEVVHQTFMRKATPIPTVIHVEETSGQGDVLIRFPFWAVNMYNFTLKWLSPAVIMCLVAFFCLLASGNKPAHLDCLGVMANLFVFEAVVLLLAAAVHTWLAGPEAPSPTANFFGMAIFCSGTVMNVWWLAWQTLRKTSKSTTPPQRPPLLPSEGAQQSSSTEPFRPAPSAPSPDGSPTGRDEQSWNKDAFGVGSPPGATSSGSGASFVRPPKPPKGSRATGPRTSHTY